MAGTMIIDGKKVRFTNEKNILQVIRNAGIELPTFCYHSELSVYGACRMCVVEDKWGGINASCSTIPKDGMVVYTNTLKLQKYRKTILELLLSNHHRDCTVCEKNGKCKLQDLAIRFGLKNIRFKNSNDNLPVDKSSCSIVRDPNKCILCGDCVRMCEEVQGVGVIGFAYRGSKIKVVPAFNKELKDVDCINCGQCVQVCPTGALVVKNQIEEVWKHIHNKNTKVVVQIAPAVRIALGEEFGRQAGELVLGKITSALRKIGFDEIYDTSFGADLTVMEESNEFINKLKNNETPLFTSCCPAWVKFAEQKYPEIVNKLSTCRSPQQMFGAIIKEHYRKKKEVDGLETVVVSVMPCTAKKYEAAREEFITKGEKDVDIVITTQELAYMIKESGIVFEDLEEEALDMPFGLATGAGIIFGVTGGVTEGVLRRLNDNKSYENLNSISLSGIRGLEGIKEVNVELEGKQINVAIVSGLKNAQKVIEMIKNGEKEYHFVEVMACPGGCIGGAGQPINIDTKTKENRMKGLYKSDSKSQIKRSEENPVILSLYNGILRKNKHLIHTKYKRKEG